MGTSGGRVLFVGKAGGNPHCMSISLKGSFELGRRQEGTRVAFYFISSSFGYWSNRIEQVGLFLRTPTRLSVGLIFLTLNIGVMFYDGGLVSLIRL